MNTNEIIDEILRQIKQPLWENWYIKKKIGSGAFSAVYKVEAQRSARRTSISALKIEPITADDSHFLDEQRKRKYIENKRRCAETEAEIMYSLRKCPYIVTYEEEDIKELYIDGAFKGYYFLIRMEYLTAVSSLIQTMKFDLSEKNIIHLAQDIGKGIMAAHRMNIIHRDIKLDNFFVDDFGTYKLGDFNISKKTGAAKTFAGTPGYLAPEIYRAKSNIDAVYTNQADIYSFGICLYQLANELLFPFEDDLDLEEAIDKRMSGVPAPPLKGVSPGLSNIILKACEFDTERRYKNIEELLDDLAELPRQHNNYATALPHKSDDTSAKPMSQDLNSNSGLELELHLQNDSDRRFDAGNLAGNTLPAFLNEDLKRNREVAQMQYNLKSDGEFLEFGSYYVADNMPKVPLRWRILAIEENKALIITFMGIDVKKYNNSPGICSWENSSLRRWLNHEFYNEAFNDSEKNLISEVNLMNYKNLVFRTENGSRTNDKVFLLSIEEAERYFPKNENRTVKPTAFVKKKGVFVAPNGNVWWWLRSSGNNQGYAADVDYGGDIDSYGSDKYNGENCVRPAIWISLSFLNENRKKAFEQSFINSHNTSFYNSESINNSVINDPVVPSVTANSNRNRAVTSNNNSKKKDSWRFKIVKLGTYYFQDKYTQSPLAWYVLTQENKKALLLSVYGIDTLPYHTINNYFTWESSQIRRWLNTDFLNTAFTTQERKFIKPTKLSNVNNSIYHTIGGHNTNDNIFLLSLDEAKKYFISDSERMMEASPFAQSKGLFVSDTGYSWWWLRSSGYDQSCIADVDYGGDVDYYGNSAIFGLNAVRPAMWVDIKGITID